MLIGAVMKNQQGQYQLNLMSINIFKEMFFFLVWLVSVQRTVTLEEVTEYYRILPASIAWTVHLQLHFTIVGVTRNFLFDELDVLFIFDINTVCPYEICKFILILTWYTSTTRNPYPCLNFLIQLWGIKVEVASFLSSLMSGKVDNLQIFCSQHSNIFVFILIFLVFRSQAFSAFRKGKLVFVRY